MANYFLAVIPKGLAENPEVTRLYSKFKRTLANQEKEVKWVFPSMWHITLHFFGPLDKLQLVKVVEELNNWIPPESLKNLKIRVQGVGAFSDPQHARVIWLGVQNSIPLNEAKEELSLKFKLLGFVDSHPEFVPHITLGRFRNPIHANELISMGKHKFFGDYEISDLVLMESVIQNHMVKYVPVEIFSIKTSL